MVRIVNQDKVETEAMQILCSKWRLIFYLTIVFSTPGNVEVLFEQPKHQLPMESQQNRQIILLPWFDSSVPVTSLWLTWATM